MKLKPDTCFGLVSGAHTYFLAADSPQEAKAWVKALRSMWMHCFKHTLRGTDAKDLVGLLKEGVQIRHGGSRGHKPDHLLTAASLCYIGSWVLWDQEACMPVFPRCSCLTNCMQAFPHLPFCTGA